MRPKMLLLMGSLVASLLAMGLGAAPAFGQEVIEAKAGDDVVARGAPTPALEELPPFANTGNVQPIPDLEPLPWFFPSDGGFEPTFCLTDGQGSLLVRVGNQQGFGPAPQTRTRVSFYITGAFAHFPEVRTPPIPAGGAVVLLVDVPDEAINNGYDVEPAVDANREVAERDEDNNFGYSTCPPGP